MNKIVVPSVTKVRWENPLQNLVLHIKVDVENFMFVRYFFNGRSKRHSHPSKVWDRADITIFY